MRPDDYQIFADLLRQHSGLVLTPDKAYLIEGRLTPVARRWKLVSLDELAQRLRGRPEDALIRDIIEAMTTNETFFFRDNKPFDMLRDIILPQLVKARSGRRSLRIWSAAASTGQEAYSIAIILAELGAQLAGWKIEIVGTDLSHEMVTRARTGLYSQFEVQRGMPAKYLIKHFKQTPGGWQVNDALRAMVQFKQFNLLSPMGWAGQFDIVFCRNVLIYFDLPTKTKVLAAIAGQVASDGFLLLGGAETILGVTDRFQGVDQHQALFRPAAPSAARLRA